MKIRPGATALILSLGLLAPGAAHAIQLDDPVNFQLVHVWTATSVGLPPGHPGAMLFSDDGQTMLIVGEAESANSAVYSVPVMRDPITRRVTGFGQATLVFRGAPNIRGLDAGMERGPQGTLFYTYWDAHHIGERAVATSTTETLFDMTPTGVPSSVAGLTFSPLIIDPLSSFRQMQVSSWLGNGIYNVPLTPKGGGIYEPGVAQLFVALPQEGTGAIQYVPQGLYTGNVMYVNWNFGEVRMLIVDKETGFPIDDMTGMPALGTMNPRTRRFAHDLGVGPWGLEFDPLTLDFFVSTWGGAPSDSIIQFSGPGFANQPPVAMSLSVTTARETPVSITLPAMDPDMDALAFQIVTRPTGGALTGTTAMVRYTPIAGFTGVDHFTFEAFDGQLRSNTATVTITVGGATQADAGGVADARADAGVVDSGGPIASADGSTTANPDASETATNPDASAGAGDTGTGTTKPGEDEDESGCGCEAAAKAGASASSAAWIALLLVGLSFARRRRRVSRAS